MAKRLSYLIAQGQQGLRSGISLGIPWEMSNDGGATATQGNIPTTAFPYEKVIYIVPDRIVGDAFNPAVYMDANPAQNEPAVQAFIEAVRLAFNVAFAAAAASFVLSLRAYTSAGALRGTIATLLDGTITTIVAFATIVIPRATMAQQPLNTGDVVAARVVVAGAGAAMPAVGGILDMQG